MAEYRQWLTESTQNRQQPRQCIGTKSDKLHSCLGFANFCTLLFANKRQERLTHYLSHSITNTNQCRKTSRLKWTHVEKRKDQI